MQNTFRFWELKYGPFGGVVFFLSQVYVSVCVINHIQAVSIHFCFCQEFVLGINIEFCQRLFECHCRWSYDIFLWAYWYDELYQYIFEYWTSFSFSFFFCSFYLIEILLYLLYKNDVEVFLDFLCSKQLI